MNGSALDLSAAIAVDARAKYAKYQKRNRMRKDISI
jgi:hypothetical protein